MLKIYKLNIVQKNNAKNILWTLLIINILFLFFYEIYLKSVLLNHFNNVKDIIDKSYYSQIFSFLEYPLIFISVILLLIIIFYKQVKIFFDKIKVDRTFMIFIISLNVIMQIIILLTIHTVPISDSRFYIEAGHRLFLTGSYVTPGGKLTAFWPVGLPEYLAFLESLTNHYLLVAKIMNLIFSSLFILVLYKLFKEKLSQKELALFLIAFVLFPNNLFSVNTILADYPFAFLLWLAIFLSLSPNLKIWGIISIAVLLGILSYLRPIGLLLPLIFAIYLFNKYSLKSSVRKIVVLFSVFLILLFPWIYRNYNVFNTFVPISTSGGSNFLMGNHVGSSGGVNFNFFLQDSLSETQVSNDAYFRAINDIAEQPVESIVRLPKKIFFTYYRGDSSLTWSLKDTENKIPSVVLSFVFFINNYFFYLIIFISILCVLTKKDFIKDSKLKYFLFSIYIYFILIVLIYVGSERYLIPLFPVHFYLASKYF